MAAQGMFFSFLLLFFGFNFFFCVSCALSSRCHLQHVPPQRPFTAAAQTIEPSKQSKNTENEDKQAQKQSKNTENEDKPAQILKP